MVDKLYEYEGPIGRVHSIRDNIKSAYSDWREKNSNLKQKILNDTSNRRRQSDIYELGLSFIHRKKSRWELIRLTAVVMGIEFAYAAITAFSGPILLEVGISQNIMSLVFALSPALGFFLSPITGSLSDRCTFRYGRRRIFMAIYGTFEVVGLMLISYGANSSINSGHQQYINSTAILNNTYSELYKNQVNKEQSTTSKEILIVIVLAIAMADFCADALQSPSRAYLLDVCNEEDHTRGLSSFTILAGCGGTVGYCLGSVDWNNFFVGQLFGGYIRTVFGLTAILFTICLILTITAVPEVPLEVLQEKERQEREQLYNNRRDSSVLKDQLGTLQNKNAEGQEDSSVNPESEVKNDTINQLTLTRGGVRKAQELRSASLISACSLMYQGNKVQKNVFTQEGTPTLKKYLTSIVKMPYSLRILLLTNVLSWMSHVSYSLYFSDYVGECIFGGDPRAPGGSLLRNVYEQGIRFACLAMAVYSLSCLLCSSILEKIIEKFGLRRVYVTNLLIDAVSMFLMFILNSKAAVIYLSFASGILYCSLFTIPYIIVAHYHSLNVFEETKNGEFVQSKQVRGLGTDISIIGSSVFIAQFILSTAIGPIKLLYGSTAVVPLSCSLLSLCSALAAHRVVYLDL